MPGMLLSIDLKIRWTEMFLKQITAPSTPGEKSISRNEMPCDAAPKFITKLSCLTIYV